jgi:chromosome segregation ATPase
MSDEQIRDFVKRQKSQIKELQEQLENSKKQYKADKAEVENLRLKDPEQYRKKMTVLDKVKTQLEQRISKINGKVAKIKALEEQFK